MRRKFTKIMLAATFGLALAFTFNACSSDNGDEYNNKNRDQGFNTVYDIKNITDNSFTFLAHSCNEKNGELESCEGEFYYSIDNKILTLREVEYYNDSKPVFGYSFHANGELDNLIGTWTKELTKENSELLVITYRCGGATRSGDHMMPWVTKTSFTQNTFAITQLSCPSKPQELYKEIINEKGIEIEIYDCNNYELSKGNERLKVYFTTFDNTMEWKFTYKGKTCSLSEKAPSVSEQRNLCKKAYNTGEDYHDLIDEEYFIEKGDCSTMSQIPEEFFRYVFLN